VVEGTVGKTEVDDATIVAGEEAQCLSISANFELRMPRDGGGGGGAQIRRQKEEGA